MQVLTDDVLVMGDVVIYVLEYARNNPAEFSFGPLRQRELMAGGLTLQGDIAQLVDELRETFKDEIELMA